MELERHGVAGFMVVVAGFALALAVWELRRGHWGLALPPMAYFAFSLRWLWDLASEPPGG